MPSTYPLRRMSKDDLPQAIEMMQSIGWNYAPDHFSRILDWSGTGAFCITYRRRVVATSTAIQYGKQRGWLGMIVTHAGHQGRGLGGRTTQTAIDHLRGRGVQEVMLDASDQGQALYERLGFRPLYPMLTWMGNANTPPLPPRSTIRRATPDDLPALVALDGEIFGAERPAIIRRLLEDFPATSWVDVAGATLQGFLIAQPHPPHATRLAPWMHRTPDGARDLLQTALHHLDSQKFRLDTASTNPQAGEIAQAFGLQPEGGCIRMIWGDAPDPHFLHEQYYGVAGFPLG